MCKSQILAYSLFPSEVKDWHLHWHHEFPGRTLNYILPEAEKLRKKNQGVCFNLILYDTFFPSFIKQNIQIFKLNLSKWGSVHFILSLF